MKKLKKNPKHNEQKHAIVILLYLLISPLYFKLPLSFVPFLPSAFSSVPSVLPHRALEGVGAAVEVLFEVTRPAAGSIREGRGGLGGVDEVSVALVIAVHTVKRLYTE